MTTVLAAVCVLGASGTAEAATPSATPDPAHIDPAWDLGAILPRSMLDPTTTSDPLPILWMGVGPGGEGLGDVPLPRFASQTPLYDAAVAVGLDPQFVTGDRGLAGDGVTTAYRVTAVSDPTGDASRLVPAARDEAFPFDPWPPADWDTRTVDGREVVVLGDGRDYLYATGPWAFHLSLLVGDDRTPMDSFLTRLPRDDAPPPPVPPTAAIGLGATLGGLEFVPRIEWSGNALVPPGAPLTARRIDVVSPYAGLLADVAGELGVDIADVYGFVGGDTAITVQAWVDPRSDGTRWIEVLRRTITATDDPPFHTPYVDRGDSCMGGVVVTHLEPDGAGTGEWMFAAGPAVFVVSSLSTEGVSSVIEELAASVATGDGRAPCGSTPAN